VEVEEARDECPPPPPSVEQKRKRKRKKEGADGAGNRGDASVTNRTVALSDPEILAISRRITGQRASWSWLADTGAADDIASARDTIKSRLRTMVLETPLPFDGVGGVVVADDAVRNLCIDELGFNFSPPIVNCPYNLLSVGKRCQEQGMDFVWLGSRKMLPYFVCNDGSAVVLRVHQNIPYLDCQGNRGVHPRGQVSKQVRLPLPPCRSGVYTAPLATAACGVATITHATTATMTTRVKPRDAATQTEAVSAIAAREAAVHRAVSSRAEKHLICPAPVADVQDPAANGTFGTASGADTAVGGAGGGAAFIKFW